MLIKSSSASWTAQVYNSQAVYTAGSGLANDGIGDPEVDHSANGAEQGGVSTSTGAAKTSALPPHWTSYPVSSGVLTLPMRTLIAKASFTGPAGGGAADFACSVGTYTIQIHPQPYNFHKTSMPVDNGDGTISFAYDWYSTTGYKSDLTTCYIHERVTYPSKANPYVAPAPFNQSVKNPTVQPSTDSSANSMATTVGSDTHSVWASTAPYTVTVTVTAPQKYEFNDTATYQQNVLIPGPDSTASIVRTITNSRPEYPAGNWWYSITKQGLTAWLKVQ